MSEEQLLFKAEIVEVDGKKDISLTIHAHHIPMLCYASKLLNLEIDNKIIEREMKKASDKRIVSPKDGLKKFLR